MRYSRWKVIKWHLEARQTSGLKPYHKNPRYIKEEDAKHLKASIIVNLDGTIIGGHQRINLMDKKSMVECWAPDRMLTDEEVEECNIRLNKNQGSFDYDILANEFEVSDLFEWGFSHEEILGKPLMTEEVIKEADEQIRSKKDKKCPHCGQEL
jgi:hypothetical protein